VRYFRASGKFPSLSLALLAFFCARAATAFSAS